jgi:hypothetical protein
MGGTGRRGLSETSPIQKKKKKVRPYLKNKLKQKGERDVAQAVERLLASVKP